MNKLIHHFLIFCFCVSLNACSKDNPEILKTTDSLVIKNASPISTNFIGNGAQWGGYEIIESWTGINDFNDSDWTKLKERMDFMRPPFIRIMISSGWNYFDNTQAFNPNIATNAFHRMMRYCTDNNISVLFGEWGHLYLNNDRNQINYVWMDQAVNYLNHLINEKGYTCIKYYNMVNEPNGSWSTTNNDYNLWKNINTDFQTKLKVKGLANKVQLTGPDIAVFGDASFTNWLSKTNSDFGNDMGLYEIHSYPTKSFVNGDNYLGVLKAYKNAVPAGKQIVVGEIGIKYYNEDANLQLENEAKIKADPYASTDSNMSVYDGFYGVDVSDAIVQTMMAGFSGALIWSVDDAMYNENGNKQGEDFKKLKKWGFWNILGEEAFGSVAEEAIRPFFYPVSLLCRFFPKGSDIMEIELPNKKGLRAIAGRIGGKYTIAIVNSNYVTYTNIGLKADDDFTFGNVSKYQYISKTGKNFIGKVDAKGLPLPEETGLSIKFDGSYNLDVPGQSVIILSNMN